MTPNAVCFGPHLPPEGRSCTVTIGTDAIGVACGDGSFRQVPYDALAVAPGGFEQDRIVFILRAGGEDLRLYIDPVLIADLRRDAPAAFVAKLDARLADMRWRRRTAHGALFLALVACLVVIVALWQGRHVVFHTVADRIPVEWEQQIGDVAYRQLLSGRQVVSTGPAVSAVRTIADRVLAHAGSHPYRFTITVVQDEAVNAVAAPGGRIIVMTGLLQQAEDADEVAGVLAHEISHVLLRHGLHGVIESAGLATLATVVFGSQSWMGATVQRLGVELLTLEYSREKEADADLHGLRLLHEAGIDPRGLIRFFERLAEKDRHGFALLSTHPMSAMRAQRLEHERERLGHAAAVPWSFDWQRVKETLTSADPTSGSQAALQGF